MRHLLLTSTLLITVINISLSQQQEHDNLSQDKSVTLSGITLCKTSIADLKNLAGDFAMVSVEEMDLPKNCYGQDSRYTSGEGYASKQFPGMIFQKGNESDYIGKIRLTPEFDGVLPNGKKISVKNLKLADVFIMFPKFKDQWFSRGCSDYWRFSNDTLAFFVKIDKNIQPQFPINESFYLDKPIEGIDVVLSCYRVHSKQQSVSRQQEMEPLIFLDGVRVNKKAVEMVDPMEIAFITVLKDANAINAAGPEGKKGVIYVYTNEYSRNKYWSYFRSTYPAYAKAVPSMKDERDVVYILNGIVLEKNIESKLFELIETDIQLRVIEGKELKKQFNIKNKRVGVVIISEP
ncbi:MAG TPA: hypothetical protein VF141_21015 [Chryseolinea sp.]